MLHKESHKKRRNFETKSCLNNKKAGANEGYLGYSLMLFVLHSGSNQRINTCLNEPNIRALPPAASELQKVQPCRIE